MTLKFYSSLGKKVITKVRKLWDLIPTLAEITGEKLEGGIFPHLNLNWLNTGLYWCRCCKSGGQEDIAFGVLFFIYTLYVFSVYILHVYLKFKITDFILIYMYIKASKPFTIVKKIDRTGLPKVVLAFFAASSSISCFHELTFIFCTLWFSFFFFFFFFDTRRVK